MKFVKRRTRGKVEDKIAKVIESREPKQDDDQSDADEDKEDEINLSDDELKHDNLRLKEKKTKKRKKSKIEEEEDLKMEFEENPLVDDDVSSFYQMNLSRPLMKAIATLGFTHPTPIQAQTIPIALLGRDICGCAATGTGKTGKDIDFLRRHWQV